MFRIADPELLSLYNQYGEEQPKLNPKIVAANLTNFRKMKLQELLELSENNYISFQLKEILADEIYRRLSS